jgi:hypothetical protein
MPTRSLPVESRSRRRPSGAGFRRTATQMALWRCATAHRGADWYFCPAQPPCSWHLPEAGQATGGPYPALEAKWLHRHPVAPRNHDSDQARASTRRYARPTRSHTHRCTARRVGRSACSQRPAQLRLCQRQANLLNRDGEYTGDAASKAGKGIRVAGASGWVEFSDR